MGEHKSRFTGKQITTMAVAAAAVVVLMPASVYAAVSAFAISDPSNGSKARVYSGKLNVGDGSGALTVDGTVRVGDGSGPLTVDGAVSPRLPFGAFSTFASGSDTTRTVLYKIPANVNLAVTSLTLSHAGGSPASVELATLTPSTPGDCLGSGLQSLPVTKAMLPGSDTRSITFTPALLIPKASAERCLIAMIAASGDTLYATTAGYRY